MDASKFTRYPGRDHRQGVKKKIRSADFFRKKIRGGEDFLTTKFEDQKVIYVGSSDSGVFIGQNLFTPGPGPSPGGEDFFSKKIRVETFSVKLEGRRLFSKRIRGRRLFYYKI